MDKITQVSGRQLTTLRKIQQRKYRYRYQLFTVEGVRASMQVLENKSVETEALFFRSSSKEWERTQWQDYTGKIPFFKMDDGEFYKITDASSPQPVLALCRTPENANLETIALHNGIIIALDRIRDPGNLGTIMRTAVWFGVSAMLISSGTVDIYHPKVVRSTAGAIGNIMVAEGELPEMLSFMEKHDWRVVLLEDRKDAVELPIFDPPPRTALVVGNEADGIEAGLRSDERISLRIAGKPGIESLNAAIAAGISLYEFSKKLAIT